MLGHLVPAGSTVGAPHADAAGDRYVVVSNYTVRYHYTVRYLLAEEFEG